MSVGQEPLLAVEGVSKLFKVTGSLGKAVAVHAVSDVSLTVGAGETLGLVGESGCGKSTLGRLIVRLLEPSGGSIHLQGLDITHVRERTLRPLRRHMQMVFQDPYGSLNPRMRAGDIVAEPLTVHGLARGSELTDRVENLFRRVGLRPDQMRNLPRQFSGGQRQRLAIARALAVEPKLIVADEPVSALDVSVQAQVVNLMVELQKERGLSYLFIAHDLGIVKHISDRIAVMYLGRIIEIGPAAAVFGAPRHPYTQSLLAAVPVPDPRQRLDLAIPEGEVPSPLAPPRGCHFHPRCPFGWARCRQEAPLLRKVGANHQAACHIEHS